VNSTNKFTLKRLIFSDMDLNAAIGLGSIITLSFFFSIIALVSSFGSVTDAVLGKTGSFMKHARRKTRMLVVFNGTLVAAGIATVVIGCIIWFYTLQERNEFEKVWLKQDIAVQQFLQNSLQCCGYWNASTTNGLFSSQLATGFCSGSNVANNVTAVQGCVTPITNEADLLLNNAFTTIFGFVAVEIALFLATVCLINTKLEEERFRRIDEKLGRKGGFV